LQGFLQDFLQIFSEIFQTRFLICCRADQDTGPQREINELVAGLYGL